jgi:hypothetical protein
MLPWLIVAVPPVLAVIGALVWLVRDRGDDAVAHLESKRRRT